MVRWTKKMTKEMALNRAMALCSKMEKCTSDLVSKLKSWGMHSEEINEIIDKLQDLNFLNEERFTKAFVRQKIEINHWGKQKIKAALHQKKVEREIIEHILNEIETEKYTNVLWSILLHKNKSIEKQNNKEQKEKLLRFALSRGFEYELANKLITKIQNNDYNGSD